MLCSPVGTALPSADHVAGVRATTGRVDRRRAKQKASSLSMRLLAVTERNDRSEIAVYRGLAASGMTVDLLCRPDAVGQDPLRAGGVTVNHAIFRNRLDLPAIRKLRTVLHDRRPDLIYATLNAPLSAALIAARRFPRRSGARR